MAPKKAVPLPPPEPEEEEEETTEEESGESEEGEESEEESDVEEKEEHERKTIQIQKQTTPPLPAPESEEEEEEERSEREEDEEEGYREESDTPPSPNVSDFTIKPISPAKPALKDAKPASKRSSDAHRDDDKDLKNKKKAKTNEGEEKKEKSSTVSASGGAGRVWSEEDEIAVLQGMIDYQNKRGSDPSNDMAAFHEFIKGKLQADISKTQLYEKVRRLKKKFFTNMEKAESGEEPVFTKTHEHKAFELSKKVWGAGSHSNGGGIDHLNAKSNDGKGKRGGKVGSISGIVKEDEKRGVVGVAKGQKDDVLMDDVRDDEEDFESKYSNLSQSFDLDGSSFFPDGVMSSLKQNLSSIDSVKARELDDKWKKLREQEADFFLKKMILMTEQTKLVLNAGKKR